MEIKAPFHQNTALMVIKQAKHEHTMAIQKNINTSLKFKFRLCTSKNVAAIKWLTIVLRIL